MQKIVIIYSGTAHLLEVNNSEYSKLEVLRLEVRNEYSKDTCIKQNELNRFISILLTKYDSEILDGFYCGN